LLVTLPATVASPFAGIAEAGPINRAEPSTAATAKPPNFQITIAALLVAKNATPRRKGVPRPRLREAERVCWLLSKLQPQTVRNIVVCALKLRAADTNDTAVVKMTI
jgi:hypothetical protein